MSLLYSSTCFEHNRAHHQEVKLVSHSIWHYHTETSEWSKITKIQFYRYEHILVKLCMNSPDVITVYYIQYICIYRVTIKETDTFNVVLKRNY